jgi:hypothetical protein
MGAAGISLAGSALVLAFLTLRFSFATFFDFSSRSIFPLILVNNFPMIDVAHIKSKPQTVNRKSLDFLSDSANYRGNSMRP